MITISVCMIVKNEEAILGRCLDSLFGIADEIIILDTGSEDATKQIAARYTNRIYDFHWIDDFAAARNESISKATMDYIYVADADEVIDEENRERFLKLKQTLLPEIDIVQMKYSNQLQYNTTYNFDEEYRPKLYKRLRSIRFVDPIHESVILTPVIYDSEIVIKHLPMNSHAERDFNTFRKIIKRDGKLSPKLYEMYAKELFITGDDKDFLEAAFYYEHLAESEVLSERELKINQCVLAKISRIKMDITGLMKCGLKNLADARASAEVCYELGEYFFNLNDYKEAIIWFYNAAYETECELNIRYAGDYPLERLADCYRNLGNKEQEEAYQALAANWRKENKR